MTIRKPEEGRINHCIDRLEQSNGLSDRIINDHDKDCPCYQRINDTNPTVRRRRDHEVR